MKHSVQYQDGDRCICGEWKSNLQVHWICDKIGHDWDWDGQCEVCKVLKEDKDNETE